MALSEYRRKRQFDKTPEPKRKTQSSRAALRFVIQKHAATRLHYDFRLELGGVLKNWAIPRGPSLDPSVKRLAMMTEDHPLKYANFEGTIPEGNYGAGNIIIWDRGTYHPFELIKDRAEAEKLLKQQLKRGDLKFVLEGKKVKGSFALVKIKHDRWGDNAWLLIKHKDNHVSGRDLTKQDRSIVSGLRVEELKPVIPSGRRERQ